MARDVSLWLASSRLRSWLPAAELVELPADATFVIVAVDRSTGTPVPTVLASDEDVPRDVTPVEFGRRCAAARGDRWAGHETDLLCCWVGDRWTAWDSMARTEERRLPMDCRFPELGEVPDLVIRAPQAVGVAA